MSLPTHQDMMLPLLRLVADGKEHRASDAVERLADEFGLSEEERRTVLASGRRTVMEDRVGWARTYLKQAGLIDQTRRGWFHITEAGRTLLAEKPERVDTTLLRRYPAFCAFLNRSRNGVEPQPGPMPPATNIDDPAVQVPPREAIARAYDALRSEVEAELLQWVKRGSPRFFEQLVVDLLIAMGYGGSRADAGRAVGQSGDGGIDGIINEDRLGLDVIYLQAKRWEAAVGRPEIQKFVGALQGVRASKGVFITTSSFTKDARDYARNLPVKIILIDGALLAALMFDHGVGVARVESFEIKRLDGDYFEEL